MRKASLTNSAALGERLNAKEQIPGDLPDAAMPPYMEMFLAHLRVLIGVPFTYLVPDARLLPDESIRFFYLDRSWTDRLVDGAIAVGKAGTREQAHHQAHAIDVQSQLDLTERIVRVLQRGLPAPDQPDTAPAGTISGFLLRSAAVSGWPSMDVRAFSGAVPAPPGDFGAADTAQWAENAAALQLRTIRLELLSPSVMLALFDGVPQLVWFEEPHHGLQFGVNTNDGMTFYVDRHEPTGAPEQGGAAIPVPVRAANRRVVAVAALRKALYQAQLGDPQMEPQTGSGALAIELLNYPWRQRFQNAQSALRESAGAFVSAYRVASVITDDAVRGAVTELL